MLDGDAVLLGVDGLSDFNGLHSRRHDDVVESYAFDCLVADGDDLRKLPLSMRMTNLARFRHGGRTASTRRHSSRAGSVPICSGMPAGWGWRAWSASTATAAAGSIAGSR